MRKNLSDPERRPRRRPLLPLAVAAALLAPSAAGAAEKLFHLDDVVVTGTRIAAGLPGTSTTVIGAEEIERSPARTLTDLLSREAGVQSRDFYSAAAADSVVDLRGFGATAAPNTLVLVNGRRLNDFDLAAVDWGNIPLASIARIEITRGNAGAVLYGDGAVGGVVNIVTKVDVPQGPAGKVDLSYGSYVHRQTDVSASHGSGPYSVNAYGTYINSRNYRRNNDVIQKNVVAELRRRSDRGDLYVNLGLDDQRLGTPGARRVTLTSTQLAPDEVRRGATTPRDWTLQNGASLTMGVTGQIADSVQAVVDMGIRKKDTEARTVSNFGPQFDSYIDTELTTWSLTPRVNLDFDLGGRESSATVGIDYYYSDYNSDRQLSPDGAAFHRYDGKQHSAALYAQHTLAATAATDVSFGARVQYTRFTAGDIYDESLVAFPAFDGHRESVTESSTEYALNLGVDHRINDAIAVFGRIARSFRAPSVDERVGSDPTFTSFALETQTSKDVEAGVRLAFGALRLQSSAFLMKLRNELHFNPDTSVNENFDPTRRWGVENTAGWRAGEALDLKANFSYTNAQFTDGAFEGNTVPLVSDWTGGVSADWRAWDEYLTLSAAVNYFSAKNMENDEKNFQPEMPGYALVDVKASGAYGPLTWSAAINNLFDKAYYNYAVASSTTYGTFNAYPLPGRTFLVEVGMTF